MPAKPSPPTRRTPPDRKLGVWIFGARGGLATTLIAGTRALARGLVEPWGVLGATDACAGVPLQDLDGLVFGGHEVRPGTLLDSARQVQAGTGAIPEALLQALRRDLATVDRDIRPGTLVNAGAAIERMVRAATDSGGRGRAPRPKLAGEVARLRRDIEQFMRRHRLRRCVCVNLVSTEPKLRPVPAHRSAAAFAKALAADRHTAVRPSTLYAWVAADLGLPFVHFTPADATLLPAVIERFDANRAPFAGADGKSGETLVKSSLAPMFRYRNLRVLSWQGYNILGDRDGAVLADAENKRSKQESKDALLGSILGYPLHTHVGIDYVPSLDDMKTAWDFIHFQGFLGFKMSMQFIWQGCDAVLAAPLVLDLVRFADLAQRRGEAGALRHLACFFKRPIGGGEHDLHKQWHDLLSYIERARTPQPAAASEGARRGRQRQGKRSGRPARSGRPRE